MEVSLLEPSFQFPNIPPGRLHRIDRHFAKKYSESPFAPEVPNAHEVAQRCRLTRYVVLLLLDCQGIR